MILKEEEIDKDEESVGLKNVLKRLQIFYEGKCNVVITSNAPEPGVCVSLLCGKVCGKDFVASCQEEKDEV